MESVTQKNILTKYKLLACNKLRNLISQCMWNLCSFTFELDQWRYLEGNAFLFNTACGKIQTFFI